MGNVLPTPPVFHFCICCQQWQMCSSSSAVLLGNINDCVCHSTKQRLWIFQSFKILIESRKHAHVNTTNGSTVNVTNTAITTERRANKNPPACLTICSSICLYAFLNVQPVFVSKLGAAHMILRDAPTKRILHVLHH